MDLHMHRAVPLGSSVHTDHVQQGVGPAPARGGLRGAPHARAPPAPARLRPRPPEPRALLGTGSAPPAHLTPQASADASTQANFLAHTEALQRPAVPVCYCWLCYTCSARQWILYNISHLRKGAPVVARQRRALRRPSSRRHRASAATSAPCASSAGSTAALRNSAAARSAAAARPESSTSYKPS